MIAFQTSIGIDRPIEEVFAYVSDPSNFPPGTRPSETSARASAAANGDPARRTR